MSLIGRIIQAKAKELKAKVEGKPDRGDLNWPMGVHIGSTLRFDPSLFIIGGEDLSIGEPQGDCVVQAGGWFEMNQQRAYRFYLKDMADAEYFLQVETDFALKPTKATLFQPVDEIYPETSDDWAMWLNEENGLIGYRDFSTPDGTQYERAWSPGKRDCIPPYEFGEIILLDPYVSRLVREQHAAMLYRRALASGIDEYLLVDKEEESGSASIGISVGVEIPVVSLTIL